mmetsp:Transcript_29277/g.63029  ORF Transcript_29277/g.63029 Transcript_29277/m.63029 type:complete len:202 (-) Transcript_29277:241-846(-)
MANFFAASAAASFPFSDEYSTSTRDAEVPQVAVGEARPWTYPANKEFDDDDEDDGRSVTESTWRFSRMARMASFKLSLRGFPSSFLAVDTNLGMSWTTVVESAEAAASATSCTNAENTSLRLAKSVSLATLTRLATRSFILIPTRPSNASRPATFDEALALPCLRNQSRANSRSLFTSGEERAFLHSIMGAPVDARSSLTN